MSKKRIIILLIVILIPVSLFFFGDMLAAYWIEQKLPGILNKDPERAYDIQYENVNINLAKQSLRFDGIRIVPHNADSTAKATAEVFITHLFIDDLSWKRFVINEEIVTDLLVIDQPDILFSVERKQRVVGDSKEINLFVQDLFSRIIFKDIEITNGKIEIQHYNLDSTMLDLPFFDLSVKDLKVDQKTILNPLPFTYGSYKFNARNLYVQWDNHYEIKVKHILLSDTLMTLDSVSFEPDISPWAMSSVLETQKDVFKLFCPKIELKEHQWGFEDDVFYTRLSSVAVHEPVFSVYKDKNVPITDVPYKDLYGTVLRSLDEIIQLDTLRVFDGKITFNLKPKGKTEPGFIFFEHVYSTVYNFTNDSTLHRGPITMDAQTMFMNKGFLKANIQFDPQNLNDVFHVSANLDSMPLSGLNSILFPVAGANLSGQINTLEFYIDGNKTHSQGEMTFLYENMKLEVYDEEEKKRGFLSVLGNLLLNNNNKDITANSATVDISAEKNPHKGFWHFIWLNIQDGAIQTISPDIIEKIATKKQEQQGDLK